MNDPPRLVLSLFWGPVLQIVIDINIDGNRLELELELVHSKNLFSLYVLFSHIRPHDVKNSTVFFKCRLMHVLYYCTYKKQKANSLENIMLSVMGKQEVQAKDDYFLP